MDAVEVRRVYLTNGANVPATAAQLGISRALVYYYVKKAAKQAPIHIPAVKVGGAPGTTPADIEAVAVYVRLMLERAHIER